MKINLNITNSAIMSAIGLVGLALYQISQGDYATAVQSFFGALVAVGLVRGQQQQQEINLKLQSINRRYSA